MGAHNRYYESPFQKQGSGRVPPRFLTVSKRLSAATLQRFTKITTSNPSRSYVPTNNSPDADRDRIGTEHFRP